MHTKLQPNVNGFFQGLMEWDCPERPGVSIDAQAMDAIENTIKPTIFELSA
jgi:hypothetical protein